MIRTFNVIAGAGRAGGIELVDYTVVTVGCDVIPVVGGICMVLGFVFSIISMIIRVKKSRSTCYQVY